MSFDSKLNHPNRNWKRRWTVDLAARTATHVDGWVIRFGAADGAPGEFVGHLINNPDLVGTNIENLPRDVYRICEEVKRIFELTLRVWCWNGGVRS